ncbi:MAG: PLP-dependent lyase/thiolase [Nanoarchaeota archaeon]|nr:PLP-dependent lyase/thiolase [Nanoarchaeota archaeon]
MYTICIIYGKMAELDRIVLKEIEYPKRMSWRLVEEWADIPLLSENDPNNPEWIPTPVVKADLSKYGYGTVYIKDESNKESNPTGTIKDRPAWDLATIGRDYARLLDLKLKAGVLNGNVGSLSVPRLTLMTEGNAGTAIAERFEGHGLPPIKLIVNKNMPEERLNELMKLYADIYMIDLDQKALSPEEIKMFSNNPNGLDLTSVQIFEPHAVFYDWHVHEVFNEKPDEVYVPYGSGRLFENFLTWQYRNLRNQDPRLKIQLSKLASMDIFGAEPEIRDSVADKLTKSFNPFTILDDNDVSGLITHSFSGDHTGTYKVKEEKIKEAYRILKDLKIEAEPSGAASLALYLQRYEAGQVDPGKKIMVVNTGKGR